MQLLLLVARIMVLHDAVNVNDVGSSPTLPANYSAKELDKLVGNRDTVPDPAYQTMGFALGKRATLAMWLRRVRFP